LLQAARTNHEWRHQRKSRLQKTRRFDCKAFEKPSDNRNRCAQYHCQERQDIERHVVPEYPGQRKRQNDTHQICAQHIQPCPPSALPEQPISAHALFGGFVHVFFKEFVHLLYQNKCEHPAITRPCVA